VKDAADFSRVLLCRPHGGLNDTLCRIAVCLSYAIRFRRHLVIDTSRCSLRGPFSDYFEFADHTLRVSSELSEDTCARLNAMRCRPAGLEARIGRYRSGVVSSDSNAVDLDTGQSVRFADARTSAFTYDYSEELLVFEGCGGGTASAHLLPQLRLAPAVREAVRRALAPLPSEYSAIHIRNTDLSTDYRALFRQVRQHGLDGPILVCSDDPRVIACARSMLTNPVLAFDGRFPSSIRSGALHLHGPNTGPSHHRAAAVDALIDLCALGGARQMFFGQTMAMRVSGFSFLASYLCCHKGIIDSLMGLPEAERRAADPTAAVVLEITGGWRHRLWQVQQPLGRARTRLGRYRARWRAWRGQARG
jgi:hypothetical protein